MKTGKFFRFGIASVYLVFISILFFLPGSALPESGWLARIWFDKWVHAGFFAMLMIAWCWAFQNRAPLKELVITAIVYGIFVEWVQHHFVANRAFDWGDWVSDIIGTLAGAFVGQRYIKK